ncbi:sugar isomerase domain-containing protein [Nocardiopsis composta]|uniref:Putative phosphosugar-binding protein n=1 Tax=Nocardiopsis composta TaxID=157465 RepID=A0A7W8QGN5_9ACTN|nr:sugar isomerase domain-containing protein [Nocardiopsis composta]MBB5430108.1 putative phosphosugar-binding protein [Nocardiopsis composta]
MNEGPDAAEAGFGARMRDHLAEVGEENAAALHAVADLIVQRVVRDGGVLLVAGSGHSMIAVAEAFFRAGGLAAVKPVYSPQLLPLHGAAEATAAERRTGLAAEVLADTGYQESDVLFVFSTSGVNPYPVELARTARERGIPVVAFTSRACSAAAPRRAGGTLAEEADHVIDTLVRPGDASYPENAPVTGPLSSLANTYLWNLLLAAVHDRVKEAGLELPLWRSANMPGGDDANKRFFNRYSPRIPELD